MPPQAPRATYWLYILELANGHLYTGYTRDVALRFRAHLVGRGARATRMSPPKHLAACWRLRCTVGDALRLEAAVKAGGRRLKCSLVSDPQALRPFVRRRGLAVRVTTGEPGAVEQGCRRALADAQARTTRSRPSRLAR
jgi:putative endonuclease